MMDDMKESIKKILREGDLALLSAKKVRQRLEEIYGQDLTYKKKEIDALLMEALEDMETVEEKTLPNSTSITPPQPPSHTNSVKRVSSPMSDSSSQISLNDNGSFASDDEIEKSKKQPKQDKKSIKSSDKVSEESDSSVDNDEELARKMQAEEASLHRTRRSTTTQKTPKIHQKKRKKDENENGEKKKRKTGTSVYSRLCYLSPQLADLMGKSQMARKDVVKRMWEIIKERNLQDPRNKQFALCDDQLSRVFGRKKIRTFGMMKYLSSQIHDATD